MNQDLLHKYFKGETSVDEEKRILNWVDESEENRKTLQKERMLFDIALFTDSKRKMREKAGAGARIIPMLRWSARIAAAVIVAVSCGFLINEYQYDKLAQLQTVTVPAGQRAQITLADGTKVWLNNAATLKYPREFSEKERNVYLDGEAYFEVTKNRHKPFTVESDAMRVRVLGTTFNFKCDKRCRIAEATLIEGEIEVKGNKDEGQIVLAPGQRAELNRNSGRLTVKQVDAKLDAVWRDNLIPFNKANIFTITKALERFYDVKIILSPDIRSDKTYSGVLKKKSTIESVLKSLQNSIPIEYKIVGNNIFISSDKK